MKLFTIALICFSTVAWAKKDHLNEKNLGQYYVFDTEGSKKDQIRHEIMYHSKQIIKAPFKAVGYCFRKGRYAASRSLHEIELFLSPSRSVHGHREQVHQALESWSMHPEVENYLERDRDASKNILFEIPKNVAALLKNSLFAVGIRLPRAAFRTLKSFVHGAGDCTRL